MDATAQEPGGAGPADDSLTEYRVIGLIGVAHFFSHLYFYLIFPMFALWKDELDLSYTQLGLLVTVFSTTTGLTQTPFGFLVDRFSAQKILIGGLIVEAAAVLAWGFSTDYFSMLALMVVAGAANGVFHPADYSILSGSVSNQRMGKAFSLHTFAGNAGFAVAPLSIFYLSDWIGWRHGLMLLGVLGIVTAIVLILYSAHFRDAPKTPSGPNVAKQTAQDMAFLLSPPILLCLLFFTLLSLGSTGLVTFLIPALGELHGIDKDPATKAVTVYLVAGSLGILVGGFIADRTTKHNRVAAFCFLTTAALVAVVGAFPMTVILVFVLMAAQGIMHGIIMPSRDMIVRSLTPDGAHGKVFGFVTTGFSIGGSIAPVVFGWVMDQGRPDWVFYGVGLIMLCSMVTVFTSGRRRAS